MLKFRDYVTDRATLFVFDIDDTMFHTTAKVKVVKNGKIVKTLDTSEFNTYTLGPDEHYDFSEFHDAKKFHDESVPIEKMLETVKKIHALVRKDPNSRVIINTARADFDDKVTFLNTFRKYGINIDGIHVERAGNIPGKEAPASKKVSILKRYIDLLKFKKVVMYDDSKSNLKALLSMKNEFPDVRFVAYHAQPDGSIKHYGV